MKRILQNKNFRFWALQVFWAIILIFIIIYSVLSFLKVWTRHNEFIIVPDLSQKTLSQVEDVVKEQNLRYEVLDSASYNPNFPKYSVIQQNPKAGEKVKKNRKIYLTINPSSYQKISVPKILHITRRSGEATLKAVGLSVGKVTYVNDIGKEIILKMSYKGKEIAPGDLLTKTSVVDLECGNGIDPNIPLQMQIDSLSNSENQSTEIDF